AGPRHEFALWAPQPESVVPAASWSTKKSNLLNLVKPRSKVTRRSAAHLARAARLASVQRFSRLIGAEFTTLFTEKGTLFPNGDFPLFRFLAPSIKPVCGPQCPRETKTTV